MLVAIGDRICLDYVSRPDAFAHLHPKLIRGAMLDAIEHLESTPTTDGRLTEFVARAADATRRREPSVGLGDDIRIESKELIGSGLELDGELLQLSVFSRA